MAASKPRFVLYTDAAGEFRWRLIRGGRVIADSGESYSRRGGVRRAVAALMRMVLSEARVVEE